MFARAKNLFECFLPIFYRMTIHPHDDMPDHRWTCAFIRDGEVNIWALLVSYSRNGRDRVG